MDVNESIALEIFRDLNFTRKEVSNINAAFEKIHLKKGDILIKPNTKVNSQYYVFSGCLRSFFIHKSGKDHTIQFAIKDWWMSDYTSFFSSEKAVMNIECLQDATIYRLTRENMDNLCKAIPGIETFFRKKLEKAFASFQKRILEYLSLPAAERYLKFIKDFPVYMPLQDCIAP